MTTIEEAVVLSHLSDHILYTLRTLGSSKSLKLNRTQGFSPSNLEDLP